MMRTRAATALSLLLGCSTSGSTSPVESAPDPAPAAEAAPAEEVADIGEARAKHVEAAIAGRPAPTPALELLGGGELDLSEVVGKKPVYLKFWATWCVPCREQMPHFESVQQRYGDDIAVVAVNMGLNETDDAVREFQRTHGLTMPIGFDRDGSVAKVRIPEHLGMQSGHLGTRTGALGQGRERSDRVSGGVGSGLRFEAFALAA
ncbi:MAG TPA: hypothetical protein DEA59_07860 [Microbacterium sp.]|nr:hypothetical protein [Microbacterium sp.]